MSKYLEFSERESGCKTKIIEIWTKKHKCLLGEIRWYGCWRQYCFYPSYGTIFNRTCMDDIIEQINILMDERKNVKS